MSQLEAKKSKIVKFEGAIAAVATPFDVNGKIDVSQIPTYANHLANIGASGVYIIGTTGEGLSLRLEERLTIVRAWHKALADLESKRGVHLTAIVHATSTVVSEMQELAREVEALNFDALALLPSIYYKNASIDWLIDYLKSVSSAAPNTPLYYYYSPGATGELPFELHDFLEKALSAIPQLAGLKFADFNIAKFSRVHALYSDRLNIMPGSEEMILPTAALGTRAANCTLFSFSEAVQAFKTIQAGFQAGGDVVEARKAQRSVNDWRVRWKATGYYLKVLKEALNGEKDTGGLFVGIARAPICFEQK